MTGPIGIFDSGLGGLTVVRAIRQVLPAEPLIYLGDTARVPYGTRSAHTVVRYALGCAEQLLQRDIKLLVVACNTASAVALPQLRQKLPVPVIGVILPGAAEGVRATRTGRIGVLATAGTIASGAYERAIHRENAAITVFAEPAPLLVPLAEEGWVDGEVPRLAVRRYLQPLAEGDVDTIVLGCTHYPLLAPLIQAEAIALIGPHVVVVDSARATADTLRASPELVPSRATGAGALHVLVTDQPRQFAEVAARFLGEPVAGLGVEAIDL